MQKIIVIARQNEEITKLCSELNKHGFQCSFTNSVDAIEGVMENTAGLLLIEFTGTPDIETLCRYFRKEKVLPVIALVAPEKLDKLDDLVDDFIVKPYNAKELATRINHLVKKDSDTSTAQIRTAGITIDPDKYEVYVDGKLVSLTFKEYELLKFLASHPGRVFTRDTLLNQVWSQDYFGGDRTVDVHIRRLRSKIEDPTHVYIETVRNIGYRFIRN
ncbi:MAG: winged helix-turn-helix domain-containing protein [Dehalococcoidales bacterium]